MKNMNTVVEINNVALGIKEYNNQRVVTLKDIDKVHERPDGTARRNFNTNKKHLIENEDYFKITRKTPMDEIRTLNISIPPKGTTLLTESGYLLLVKSFTDDLAWEVQRKLVSSYFRSREEYNQPNIQSFVDAITAITNTLSAMQQDIVSLKETQPSLHNQLPKKRFLSWTSRMFPKYQLLMDYFEVSRKELYHNLYIELQNLYPEIDLHQEQDDYCYENGLDSCFTLDVIEHSKDLRKLFEAVVDNLLHQYGLSEESETTVIRETIFSRKIDQ